LSELDEEWRRVLAEAERRARASGRGDLIDYLTLRARNDLARKTGIEWLFETFTTLAGEANRAGASITIKKEDAHRFQVGSSTMVGTLLTFRVGVRSLMVEAGWPRAPGDGIVRGGGLAYARLRHFGNRKADEDLLLVHSQNSTPHWFALDLQTGARTQEILEARVRQHLHKLLSHR
jgi:hypothetical protein